jgi:demethylmenaquinone methyltransferase/2-methoxy-6-polyprenyl-1,4-benzoquinol methylase
MFDGIAANYDRFNALASFGLDKAWRRSLVRRIPPGAKVLDIATGTGDLAFLARAAGHAVAGLDFSEKMLVIARQKDNEKTIRWICGSADRLPFSDRSFGCITSAFALRNLRGRLDRVFAETSRVLRTGGKALHLEFSRPKAPLLRWGHELHLSFGLPLLGRMICGKSWPQDYLGKSIQEFFEPEEILKKLSAAGFKQVSRTSLHGGIVTIFEGTKG